MRSEFPLHVVVGGSSHVGREVCSGLSSQGRKVLSTYFSNQPPPQVGIESVRCDVTSVSDCDALAASVFETNSRVFLTYLSASKVDKVCHRLAAEDWLGVLNVNLNGAFYILSSFLRRMRPEGYGRIVLIGSVVGRVGAPGTSAYSASKEALRGLSRAAAVENATMGITVNYIELGYMNVGLSLGIPANVQEGFKSVIPAKKFGTPGNLTEAIIFLEKTDYITGSVITISGGL